MKKLTAGIFTALLGLVTVNAANAAIPSTTYVDTKITTAQTAAEEYADTKDAALKTAIETDYEAADTALDGKITTNANAISAMDTAYKAADTALDGRVDTLETTVGSGAMTVNGAAQADVIAAINALDTKTNGIASEGALTTLQETVSEHTTDISGLEGRMATAEGEIDTLQSEMDAVEAKAATNETAIATLNGGETVEGSVAKAEADAKAYADSLAGNYESSGAAAQALAEAKNYADGLNTTATAAIEVNEAAIKSNDTDIANLQSKDTELANSIATKAEQSALDTTNTNVTNLTGRVDTAEDDIDALETKTAGLKSLAYQDIIDNSDITDGTIAQAKITNLTTDLDAKVDDSQVIAEAGTVTNADAEIPTIARMEAALEEKMPLTTTADTNIGADGTYVLTATTVDGTTTYKWEEISRVAGTN